MYATPQKDKPGGSSWHHGIKSTNQLQMTPPKHNIAEVGSKPKIKICIPSGTHVTVHNLSPFEQKQNAILTRLIKNQRGVLPAQSNKSPHRSTINHENSPAEESNANNGSPSSFNFSLDDDTFVPDAPETAQFRKSTSVDGINTNFVKDNTSTTWQFSAGSGDNDTLPQSRSQSTNKADRRSPIRRRPVATVKAPNFGTQATPSSTTNSTSFDPEQYKFEPQMFAPPRPSTPSKPGSPTRPGRANTKKVPRTPKPMSTSSTAAVVDFDSDDGYIPFRGRNGQPKAATVGSPQAMDIDSPLTASPSATPISTPPPLVPTTPSVTSTPIPVPAPIVPPHTTHHQHHSPVARNIHVEPSRPEWRPGNVTGLGQARRQSEERKEIPINFKGSEDSEEFRATFEDFKNVAPFAPPKPGLKSFTELKDNLPFESQASAELHLNDPSQPQQLELPDPPLAPGLPLMVEGAKPNASVWTKYLEEFEGYLRRWDIFNSQVVDHFATRKANISNARMSKGYSFLGVRGDTDVLEYYNWVEQDNGVRRMWLAACEEHEIRFREFMAFREKMKMPI